MIGHCPTHDPAAERIQNHRQIHELLQESDIGDVSHPEMVHRRRSQFARQIRVDQMTMPAVRRRRTERTLAQAQQVVALADTPHTLVVHRPTLPPQQCQDWPVAQLAVRDAEWHPAAPPPPAGARWLANAGSSPTVAGRTKSRAARSQGSLVAVPTPGSWRRYCPARRAVLPAPFPDMPQGCAKKNPAPAVVRRSCAPTLRSADALLPPPLLPAHPARRDTGMFQLPEMPPPPARQHSGVPRAADRLRRSTPTRLARNIAACARSPRPRTGRTDGGSGGRTGPIIRLPPRRSDGLSYGGRAHPGNASRAPPIKPTAGAFAIFRTDHEQCGQLTRFRPRTTNALSTR